MEVFLNNNNGYKWQHYKNTSMKGVIFDENGEILEVEQVASLFLKTKTIAEFKQIIKSLGGMFSVVLNITNKVFLATDITRTFPIFYIKNNNQWLISDDANYIQDILSLSFDVKSESEFLCAGYVLGGSTLLQNLNQLEAAEVVELTLNEENKIEYWTYATNEITDKNFTALQKQLLKVFDNIANKIITTSRGATIALPLSGGYDSRLIATLLKKKEYKNVICFSYGAAHSHEVQIAKKVSKQLNYPFIQIEYSDHFISNSLEKQDFEQYIKYASNYASLSHVQDYLAVKYLKGKNLIPLDSIFMPGHSGDIFAGTHIAKELSLECPVNFIALAIKNKHFSLCDNYNGEILINESRFPYSSLESWSWKERQSKFIVNSLRVYEYFGYKSFIPLWDKELATFFKKIPYKYKNRTSTERYNLDENMYDSTIFKLFTNYEIDFKKKEPTTLVSRISGKIVNLLLNRPDLNNFRFLMKKIDKNYNNSFRDKITLGYNINRGLALYFLKVLKSSSTNEK